MSDDHHGITVVGVGTANATPDLIQVDIGVSVRAETVADAASQARHDSGDLIDSLTTSGVAREDIATRAYSIHPEYDHHDGKRRLLGFRVSNQLHVSIREIGSAGEILDAAVASVGDPVTVNRVLTSVADQSATRTEARESAWEDAKDRAEHLASLAGRNLGPVQSIVESTGQTPTPRAVAQLAAADSTPIEAGTSTITVTLEVRFSLD